MKAFAGSIVPVFWMFILKFMLSKQHKIVFKYILVGLNKINFLPKAEFLQLERSATSIIKVQETQLPVEACQTHRHSQNSGADFAKNFTFTKRSMDVWSPRCPIPLIFPPKPCLSAPFFPPGSTPWNWRESANRCQIGTSTSQRLSDVDLRHFSLAFLRFVAAEWKLFAGGFR